MKVTLAPEKCLEKCSLLGHPVLRNVEDETFGLDVGCELDRDQRYLFCFVLQELTMPTVCKFS